MGPRRRGRRSHRHSPFQTTPKRLWYHRYQFGRFAISAPTPEQSQFILPFHISGVEDNVKLVKDITVELSMSVLTTNANMGNPVYAMGVVGWLRVPKGFTVTGSVFDDTRRFWKPEPFTIQMHQRVIGSDGGYVAPVVRRRFRWGAIEIGEDDELYLVVLNVDTGLATTEQMAVVLMGHYLEAEHQGAQPALQNAAKIAELEQQFEDMKQQLQGAP